MRRECARVTAGRARACVRERGEMSSRCSVLATALWPRYRDATYPPSAGVGSDSRSEGPGAADASRTVVHAIERRGAICGRDLARCYKRHLALMGAIVLAAAAGVSRSTCACRFLVHRFNHASTGLLATRLLIGDVEGAFVGRWKLQTEYDDARSA